MSEFLDFDQFKARMKHWLPSQLDTLKFSRIAPNSPLENYRMYEFCDSSVSGSYRGHYCPSLESPWAVCFGGSFGAAKSFEDAEKKLFSKVSSQLMTAEAANYWYRLFYFRGESFWVLSEHVRAVECFTKALGIMPDSLEAMYGRERSLQSMK